MLQKLLGTSELLIMPSTTKQLHLTDTLANWPWNRVINPHYEEVKAESNTWFHSFNVFSARSLYAFYKCDFGQWSFVLLEQ